MDLVSPQEREDVLDVDLAEHDAPGALILAGGAVSHGVRHEPLRGVQVPRQPDRVALAEVARLHSSAAVGRIGDASSAHLVA